MWRQKDCAHYQFFVFLCEFMSLNESKNRNEPQNPGKFKHRLLEILL